jgi:hypothetical protein
MFLDQVGGIIVPFLYMVKPVKICPFPFGAQGFQRAAGPPARNIHVVGEIRDFVFQSHVKFIRSDVKMIGFAILVKDLTDTTHTLVFNTLIEVQYGYFDWLGHGLKNKQNILALFYYSLARN